MDQQLSQVPYDVPLKQDRSMPAYWRPEYYYDGSFQTVGYHPNQGLRVRQHTSPAYVQSAHHHHHQQHQQQQHQQVPPIPPSPAAQANQTGHTADHYYYQQQAPPMPYPTSAGRPATLGVTYPHTGVACRPTRKRRRPPHSYATLIAQAILTAPEQRLTLREIYEWIQTRYPHLYEANETGWQNTIRHNLSLNRCFMKLPRANQGAGKAKGSKGGYWTVDIEKLNHTNFGRQIIDSGFMASTEYWQQQQQSLEEQQHQERQHQITLPPSASYPTGFSSRAPEMTATLGEFDFDNLVAPTFDQQAGHPTQSITSKTSSVRESMSPGSTASSSMNTPMLPSNQHQHPQSIKYEQHDHFTSLPKMLHD